ncbi:hypothetical protein NQ315_008990, partial [Exocentrus adspersus]
MRRYCRENPVKYSLLSAARVSIHRDTDERATHRSPPRAAAETKSYSYLPKDSKSTVLATRTPGPSLAYTLGVARRHKQLLAGNQTQQTCRPRVPDQQSRRKFAQVRKASPEPAAQTPAKAQVYPGHSKAKEPVADQPLPQADVPPASQRTSTELTSQE